MFVPKSDVDEQAATMLCMNGGCVDSRNHSDRQYTITTGVLSVTHSGNNAKAASHRRRRVTDSIRVDRSMHDAKKIKVAKAWLLGGDIPPSSIMYVSLPDKRLWSLGIRKVCCRALSDVGLLLCDAR